MRQTIFDPSLNELLGPDLTIFGIFEDPSSVAFDEAQQSFCDSLKGNLYPGMSSKEIDSAFVAAERGACQVIEEAKNQSYRLIYVQRQPNKFEIIHSPSLLCWMKRFAQSLRKSIREGEETAYRVAVALQQFIDRLLTLGQLAVDRCRRSILASIAVLRCFAFSGHSTPGPESTFRDLVPGLLSPRVLAAGGLGSFILRI